MDEETKTCGSCKFYSTYVEDSPVTGIPKKAIERCSRNIIHTNFLGMQIGYFGQERDSVDEDLSQRLACILHSCWEPVEVQRPAFVVNQYNDGLGQGTIETSIRNVVECTTNDLLQMLDQNQFRELQDNILLRVEAYIKNLLGAKK